MSDEEEVYSEEEEVEEVEEEEEEEEQDEEEVEEEVEEHEEPVVEKHERRHSEIVDHEDEEGLTEAEKAMLAAKRRHEEEDKAKLENYEERRKKEREAEEEELRMLKEKQERRKLEREQEEKEMAERKRLDEERRRKEEEDRRARQDEEKKRKEEEKNKRQQMNFGGGQGGRNFVIPEKTSEKNDKFGNIVQAKQEMGMTKDQQEEAKKVFLNGIRHNIPEASSISADELKAKIKELHHRICKLEADKYDLEKRHERQEYDLKELNERSRQVARNASGKVTDSGDTNSRHPPKVQILSKYDRQIDRRNFKERRSMYENKNAFPCFPGMPPPPTLFEKVIKKYDYELAEEEEAEEIEDYE
ncbi:hypothetical protein RB195_002643 [Necator americanus]